ncbi:MAG: 4-hydroxy-tetrahydrodipicolinate reductase, partial [Bacteroidales bacterium]|nr:4-hydroxy-tetrahydrodipicolinate reductase [Bacteroidales bacterium]
MKAAIIGYGKMGRIIESRIRARGDKVVSVIDKNNRDELKSLNPDSVDVAFEFTEPDATPQNLITCFEAGIPVVCGTTGWLNGFNRILAEMEKLEGTLFYASNFSIGVNLLFKLTEKLSAYHPEDMGYSFSIQESHHIHKKDTPSGTALTLAGKIIDHSHLYHSWTHGLNPGKDELPITSIREGEVIGIHEVHLLSPSDRLTLRHEAFDRNGFAMGAITAASFI